MDGAWTGRVITKPICPIHKFDPIIPECHDYTVYGHLTPSYKWYFGITKQSPKKRWGSGHGYFGNIHFKNAIIKYGWNNIVHLIIGTGLTKEEACSIEKELIREYNTTDRRFGYNRKDGGDTPWNSGLKSPFTQETLVRMRQSHLGQVPSNIKPVWCIETGKFYMSASEASIELGLNKDAVGACCRHKHKSAGGLHWSYLDEPFLLRLPIKSKKTVVCVETNKTFDSVSSAARCMGVTTQAIAKALRSGKPSCGFHWKYQTYSHSCDGNKIDRKTRRKTYKHKQAKGQQALF